MVADIKRQVKIVTEQRNIDKPPVQEGFPMKKWHIEIYLLDENGVEKPANCFTKATYNLHPSFEKPVQVFTTPPFRCENEGWGEFDMTIDLNTSEKGGKTTLVNDLNFAQARYESKHTVTFKNPSQNLIALLRETGPVPGDENGGAGGGGAGAGGAGSKKKDEKKRKRPQVDMEKLADGLVKLDEEDLLQVVQMIHDNKAPDTYTKNDVEQGEFHVDLYTLPDQLIKELAAFVNEKGGSLA